MAGLFDLIYGGEDPYESLTPYARYPRLNPEIPQETWDEFYRQLQGMQRPGSLVPDYLPRTQSELFPRGYNDFIGLDRRTPGEFYRSTIPIPTDVGEEKPGGYNRPKSTLISAPPVTGGNWTREQQAIVDRITSGRTDYTFGPGSPNPTKEDLGTYVGGPYSPAGGFAVHGGVALAPSEYNLFSPEQRRTLGIMDIAPKDQAGQIERYFSAPGYASAPGYTNTPSYLAQSQPAQPAPSYAYGTGSNLAQMSSGQDYMKALSAPSPTEQAGAGIMSAFQNLGKGVAQGSGMNPMAMLQQRPPAPIQGVDMNQLFQIVQSYFT